VLDGTYWTTDVEIMQARERPAATARVQVLRVERVTCLRHARDCEPRERPVGRGLHGRRFRPRPRPGIGADRRSAIRSSP
jgi:hypothetical protein